MIVLVLAGKTGNNGRGKSMRFECEIYELLRPFHLKGKNIGLFDLIEAVALVTEEPGRIHAVQKEVYMVIAAERRCSWMAIESSIRRALEQAWKHNRRYMDELTGYALDSCPTAAEFVYICATTIIKKHMGTMK